jgi:hypothetical protein
MNSRRRAARASRRIAATDVLLSILSDEVRAAALAIPGELDYEVAAALVSGTAVRLFESLRHRESATMAFRAQTAER